MAKLTFRGAIVMAMLLVFLPNPAEAGGGGGGKPCKHQSFDACYNKCVPLTGGGYFAIKKCAKHCGKRVCPPNS